MDQTIPVDGGMATTRSYQNLPQRRRPICKAQRGDVYWTYMNLSGTRQMGRRDRVRQRATCFQTEAQIQGARWRSVLEYISLSATP